jgi:hypothetical protein
MGSMPRGIDDILFDVEEVEATEEVVEETQGITNKAIATNYNQQEDVVLCYPWINVSLNSSIGTDQSKEKFWARIEEEVVMVEMQVIVVVMVLA